MIQHVLISMRLAFGGAILGSALVGIISAFVTIPPTSMDAWRIASAGLFFFVVLGWALRQDHSKH